MGKITTLPVIETFYSIQGEGTLAGVPSTFIRFAGCPVRCSWCDTAYAWTVQKAQKLTIPGIWNEIGRFPTRHVVLTGGEPLMHPKISDLSGQLTAGGYHVTIETAAVVDRDVRCDLLSISPKLPGAVPGKNVFRPSIIQKLIARNPQYQVKFVVENLSQVCQVGDVLEQYPFIDRSRVMLMPNAKTAAMYRKIAPKIAKYALHENLHFCPRLHLELQIK